MRANRLSVVLISAAAVDVCNPIHNLEMRGVYAVSNTTQMVYFEPIWNWTNKFGVGRPVYRSPGTAHVATNASVTLRVF